MAVDPTYPLYPIFCIISAFLMFLVLTHSFIRQSWNLAVTFLCIGLFLDNLTHGINAVVWRDNADIKVPVYCDIVSRVRFLMNFLPSITSLLVTRKLYLIATMRDIEAPSGKTRLFDLWVEWGWGLGYPVLMTAVVYTLCQVPRFVVVEGFGCAASTADSWFSFAVIFVPPVIAPLISIFFYCPRVIRTIHFQTQHRNEFFQTNGSISRTSYFRILALACVDIVITLPFSIMNLVSFFADLPSLDFLPPYVGWKVTHADFAPVGVPYADLTDTRWHAFNMYFGFWRYPVLAIAIFALFGLTSSARAAYRSRISRVAAFVGWKPKPRMHQSQVGLDSLTFAAPGHRVALQSTTRRLPDVLSSGHTFADTEMGQVSGNLGDWGIESASGSAASMQHSKTNTLVA
ncbi:pheromone A receptor-domain-containing protein [Mycena filopes]|nr:pheromone A receptor-domain-containing protein [Mycena filopes]